MDVTKRMNGAEPAESGPRLAADSGLGFQGAGRLELPVIPQLLCGIIGNPLGHSLSPLLHNWTFRETGVAGAYMAWPVPSQGVDDFMAAVLALPIWGLSVTIPHKTAVMKYCEDLTTRARAAGAVNTLHWKKGLLVGENTDVEGFLAPLGELGIKPASALVLGAGGASRAVVAGLREWGLRRITVTNRSPEAMRTLSSHMRCQGVEWEERTRVEAELIVNATPLGMLGERQDETPWPQEAFRRGQIAYDLIYNPGRTRFLREAREAGCAAIPGLEMFLHQAAAQFRLWTDEKMPLDGARRLLKQALGQE